MSRSNPGHPVAIRLHGPTRARLDTDRSRIGVSKAEYIRLALKYVHEQAPRFIPWAILHTEQPLTDTEEDGS